jgi:hypothetical protein
VIAVREGRWLDQAARTAERGLRLLADPRLGVALLIVAGAANGLAAAEPGASWLLDAPPYLLLVGAILLTGVAAVAVRLPAAWREWRRPAPLAGRGDLLVAELAGEEFPTDARDRLKAVLRASGYRVQTHARGGRWTLAGVRRGWARFAGLGSHLSLVVLVVGAATGTAFAEETRFGLFPGEQAFLAEPRPGLTSAVRFDRLDARFEPETGLPTRFDTHVTFLRDGGPIRSQVLRVNEPGDFDGYLVHAWTYGPAVAFRVEDLGGGILFDGWVALGGEPSGSRAPFVELPQLGMTIGLDIADASANTVRAIAADDAGRVVDTAVIGPGDRARLGSAAVSVGGFSSYVTFLSRRDPGVLVLFAGAGLLVASLAVAFYLPRRRVDLTPVSGGLRLRLRGERFEQPAGELDRLVARVIEALK